jgi:hypothetical protein
MTVRKHAKATIKALTAGAQGFLDGHALYGAAGKLPVTTQKVKDLAQQLSDGLITDTEAHQLAEDAITAEMATLSPADQSFVMDEITTNLDKIIEKVLAD